MARVEKEVPFTKIGMKSVKSLQDAVSIFSKKGFRVSKIVNLYQEAHELNLYNASINMSSLKGSKPDETTKKIIEVLRTLKKGNDSKLNADRIKKAVYQWYGVTQDVIIREPVDEVVKS